MSGILRVEQDVGLLTNVRMAAEIATGLAFLTGRRLSMPFERRIPPAPASPIEEHEQGRPAHLLDLFELPVEILHSDEWGEAARWRTDRRDWGNVSSGVFVWDDEVDLATPAFADFANGRTRIYGVPESDAPVLEISGRLLSFYSYFFFTSSPGRRRQLHAVVSAVRPRRPYLELAATLCAGLGSFNAAHIRRSDLTIGIPAYKEVDPQRVADTVASVLPADEPLMVCSEIDGSDEFFGPLRRRFPTVLFANDLILGDHRRAFFDLPRHEDNALGLVTQEVAARSAGFVGTIGSTFTAMIQRQRLLRDPLARFCYTADYTPDGPEFRNGEFHETQDGTYTWNRLGYTMSPDVLSWFREWPEAA